MPVLAIDAATMVSSAAVATKDRLLAEVVMQLKKPQSEVLMGHIMDALAIAHVDKSELTGIAVNIGPGSFTGLRIGLAAAKMMAYALDIPIAGIRIDEVLAYHYPVENIYSAAFVDAQKGNVYFSLQKWDKGCLQTVREMTVLEMAEAVDICEGMDRPVVAMGDVVQRRPDEFARCLNTRPALPHHIMPRAANTAFAGIHRLASGRCDNVMTLEPLYIRRSEAEELWEKRRKEQGKN
ncbi:tRNA (adenosine(37)-N6)-threonylcarbamoyltransferase complex dimerization subunit type 1 TsaB [Pectinatus haikarae]|uniref:tRNA threonylcarbamoyladenosine biosynthesis protein TsaB n=1 Tax=Pectinatus haikarae TaxID=349096 RepID=A0ABT9YAH7_9FIRM|nr:tRNA (adenosine(37)-N6)-threonylcarbamoyltransferase complex dimerization subunit type 1 TsaB [Pectinatus haikarae]MDQ0204843.1 tRNA threonylcarbamoyladenosine biosynthesis protein TsaB [Pectinatus haikarae]